MKTIYLKISIQEEYDDVDDQLVLEDFINNPNALEWTVELIENSEIFEAHDDKH